MIARTSFASVRLSDIHPSGKPRFIAFLKRLLVALCLLPGSLFAAIDPDAVHTGEATVSVFDPATGWASLPPSLIAPFYAALNAPQYDSGPWAGAWVEVTGPEGTVAVQIVDRYSFDGVGDLDFGLAAFEAITGKREGRFPISWKWISAPGDIGPLQFYSQGSHSYYLKLQVANIVNPVASMEIQHEGSFVAMTSTNDNHFEFIPGVQIPEPFTIRVTDIFGNSVVTSGLMLSQTATGQHGTDNFPARIPAQIVVEYPPMTVIADDGTQDLGFSIDGGEAIVAFTIRNPSSEAVTGIATTLDGPDAGSYKVAAPPVATLAPGETTTFTVAFVPSAVGPHAATVHIASSSADPELASYDIHLTAVAVSSSDDTDADGMNDAAEARLAALGFDWNAAQPDLVALYYENANLAGLYTPSQVHALHMDRPLIERDAATGKFLLTFGLQQSSDLETFVPFPFTAPEVSINETGQIEFEFASPAPAAFFRLEAN